MTDNITLHTDEAIREEYKRVREIVSHTPTLDDMNLHSRYSRNCFSSYPFTRLQRECNDTPHVERGVSKEQLIDAFRKLQGQLGRIPTQSDLDLHGRYRTSYYRTRWGNYDSFLKELRISKRKAKQRSYQQTELVLVYLLLKKAFEIREDERNFPLNHTVLENLKYKNGPFVSPSTFSRRFGGWSEFVSDVERCDFSNSLDKLVREILDRGFSGQNPTVG